MVRKWLVVCVVVGLIASAQVKQAAAAAFEGPGVGVRPLSMGGAYIGLADDWLAFIWNPAGLAQLDGKGAGFSLDYVPAKASDGNSLANAYPPPVPGYVPGPRMNTDQRDVFFQYPDQTGQPTEPLAFNNKDVESTVYLPTLGGYTQFKGFAIAGGIYVPMGYSSEWDDTVANGTGSVTGSYRLESFETVGNLSTAKRVLPNLLLGGGLNVVSWKLEKEAKKTTPAYVYNSAIQADGTDVEYVLGGLYSPLPNLSVGFVYKSGSKIELEGDAKTTYPAPPPYPTGTMQSEASDLTMIQRLPATYGLGIAYRPMPALVLTMDWNRTDWSKQEDKIDFATQNAGFLNENALGKDKSLGWEDTNKIRLGAEYKLNKGWTLRGGLCTDPSPIPDKAVSLTNMIDMDRVFYTLGAGYTTSAQWQFDLAIQHNKAERTAEGVKYERGSTSCHMASSYKF